MKSKTLTQDTAGVLYWPPAIFLMPLILSLIAHWVYPIYLAPQQRFILLGMGSLAGVMAVALALWAERTMHRAGTNVNPYKPTTQVVTEGPFRYTRNPMYLAMTIFYLGISSIFNALWPLFLLPLVLLVITYGVIKREEFYLEKKFGIVYVEYKARVRRWL
jgi:protein-S-isoprenylcysteine O-methyltransferase Ste14